MSIASPICGFASPRPAGRASPPPPPPRLFSAGECKTGPGGGLASGVWTTGGRAGDSDTFPEPVNSRPPRTSSISERRLGTPWEPPAGPSDSGRLPASEKDPRDRSESRRELPRRDLSYAPPPSARRLPAFAVGEF